MYQLRFNNTIIYDPRGANRRDKLIILNPKTKLMVNGAGSMSFTLQPDHPHLSMLTRMHGSVELLQDGQTIYRGRITNDVSNFDREPTVRTEGRLACLNDSIIEPFVFPDNFLSDPAYQEAAQSGNVVEYFLRWLIAQHNAQVGPEQQLHLGSVTVRDPNNYLTRSSDNPTKTWTIAKDKLFGSELGGYLIPRYEDDGTYVDYFAELPLTNTQTVEFAKNLLDMERTVDATGIYTAIYPIGKDKITIADLDDEDLTEDLVKSGSIIFSRSAEEELGGRITKIVEWKDVTSGLNLREKAAQKLALGMAMPETIKCKACDLHMVNGTVQAFRVGRMVRVQSRPHNLTALYPLLTLEPDIFAPDKTVLDLGQTTTTLTGTMIAKSSGGTATGAGKDGKDGIGVSSMSVEYYLSTSQDELIDGKWQAAAPAITAGTYLWSRDVITYSNGTVSYTAPWCVTKGVKESVKSDLDQLATGTTDQITGIQQTMHDVMISALKAYTLTEDFSTYQESMAAQLAVLANQIEINLTSTSNRIDSVNGDLQAKIDTITKAYRFTADGLIIGESDNDVLIRIDNDVLQILKGNYPVLEFDQFGGHMDALHINTIYIGDSELRADPDTGEVGCKEA